jgi:hypothetical protein
MKTILLLTLLVLISFNSSAQWKLKKVDTRDLLYSEAYIREKGLSLKMRLLDTNVVLYLKGNYFEDERPLITLELSLPEGTSFYSIKGIDGYYEDIMILYQSLDNSKLLRDLKKSYKVKVTIYDQALGNTTRVFKTENTEEAFNFVK